MPILPHNQRAIDGLKPTPGRRVAYRSQVVVGLTLEVMSTGTKTWRVRYRTRGGRHGKTRAYTIGDAKVVTLGQAVDKAKEVLAAVQVDGRDPHLERVPQDGTFESLFERWLEKHAKLKKKSWKHDTEMFERHVRKRLGSMVAADIRRADIIGALDDIARVATGIQANRAQTLISAVFNWAVNEGLLETAPTYRIPKRGVELPRERVLSEAEIKTFWRGLADGPASLAVERVLRLALVTGQRRGEVVGARKSELNLTAPDPAWTIPGARTKNGIIHRVPLTPLAADLFAKAVADSQADFVFPGRDAPERSIDPHAVTRAMSRLTAKLGIANATVHDLRRTMGTGLARLGVSRDIRARVLNHVDGARSVTDAVYNQHEFWTEKRTAMELWEADLLRMVSG